MDINTEMLTPMDIEHVQFPLLDLPRELCVLVCSQVETLKDWSALSRTCRLVYELCNCNAVWKMLTSKVIWKIFNQEPPALNEDPFDSDTERAVISGSGSWKSYCYEGHLLAQERFKWANVNTETENSPSARLGHTGCTIDDHTIVYIGGYNDYSPPRFSDIFFFDSRTRKFDRPKIHGNEPYCIARHASVFINGTIFSFGGYDGEGTFYGLSAFNVGTKNFEYPAVSFGKEPGRRTNHAATAVKNKMYIYGGNKDENNVYIIYDDLQCFDTETRTWTDLTPHMKGDLPGQVIGHKMVSIGNMIYLVGGGIWYPRQDSWTNKYNSIYSFDTETLTWKRLTVKGEPLSVCTFTMVWAYKSFIFVFGGQEMTSEVVSRHVWIFDTVTHTGHVAKYTEGSKAVLARDMGTTSLVKGGVVSFAGSSGSAVAHVDMLHHKLFDLEGELCTKQRLGDF